MLMWWKIANGKAVLNASKTKLGHPSSLLGQVMGVLIFPIKYLFLFGMVHQSNSRSNLYFGLFLNA